MMMIIVINIYSTTLIVGPTRGVSILLLFHSVFFLIHLNLSIFSIKSSLSILLFCICIWYGIFSWCCNICNTYFAKFNLTCFSGSHPFLPCFHLIFFYSFGLLRKFKLWGLSHPCICCCFSFVERFYFLYFAKLTRICYTFLLFMVMINPTYFESLALI